MGELVRRLDYERRSRQKFHLADTQRINREYSTSVRAANAMEDRKKDLYIKKTEMHTRLFLGRYEYEKKQVENFKEELDVKSQNFDEEKFQVLRRAQSAIPRMQSKNEWTAPVVEIIPREYYRNETKTPGVTFKDEIESDSSDEESDDNKPVFDMKAGNDKTVMGRTTPLSLGLKVRMTRRNSVQYLRRRRISLAYITDKPHEFDQKCLPAVNTGRRKSAPPRLIVYVPRDVSAGRPEPRPESRAASRRGSRSSLGSVSEVSEPPDSNNVNDTPSRSYRVLREAFKKQRKERHDPSKERFNAIKKNHQMKDEQLRENAIKRFDEIFAGQEYIIY